MAIKQEFGVEIREIGVAAIDSGGMEKGRKSKIRCTATFPSRIALFLASHLKKENGEWPGTLNSYGIRRQMLLFFFIGGG